MGTPSKTVGWTDAESRRGSAGGARRILVVDDNRATLETMAALLRGSGHEVHTANDGQGAIVAAFRVRPEFVFLDIALPGLDGCAVAKQLRQDPGFAEMRIIAVTGFASDEDRQRCMEAGCDAYLVKPLDHRYVESLLGRRS